MVILRLKAVIFSDTLYTYFQATLSVVKRLFIAHLLVVNHVTKLGDVMSHANERETRGIEQRDWLKRKTKINEMAVN